jgi:hypothetical protein
MNTSRATVGIAIAFLAAALSLAIVPHEAAPAAYAGDPSVPPASEVFRNDTKPAEPGNVTDLAY